MGVTAVLIRSRINRADTAPCSGFRRSQPFTRRVFQPTHPARGAPAGGQFHHRSNRRFNPRGAALGSGPWRHSGGGFNPSARAGRALHRPRPASRGPRFQPRRPREARPRRLPSRPAPPCFNPRAPRGARRRTPTSSLLRSARFQPTHPRGARCSMTFLFTSGDTFQPTRPRGARRRRRGSPSAAGDFNPRAHAGRAPPSPPARSNGRRNFNPRAGALSDGLCEVTIRRNFNPRPRGARPQAFAW